MEIIAERYDLIFNQSDSHRHRSFDENEYLFQRCEVLLRRFAQLRPQHVGRRHSGAVSCDLVSIIMLRHTRMTVPNIWVGVILSL